MDEQTGRVKKVLREYLCIFVNYDENTWYHFLPLAPLASNKGTNYAHKIIALVRNPWLSSLDGMVKRTGK